MKKVTVSRKAVVATVPIIILLTGCTPSQISAKQVAMNYIPITYYDDGTKKETIKFDELKNIGVYFTYKINDYGITYDCKFLEYYKYDDYEVYVDVMDGTPYYIRFDEHDIGDDFVYSAYYNKNIIYMENVLDEVYDCENQNYFLTPGINYETEEMERMSLQLMYADYMAHNSEEVKKLVKQVENQ